MENQNSNVRQTTFCTQCGAKAQLTDRFCACCGCVLPNNFDKNISSNEAQMADIYQQEAPKESLTEEMLSPQEPPVKKRGTAKFVTEIIKHSVLIILSVLLLLSVFFPFAQIDLDDYDSGLGDLEDMIGVEDFSIKWSMSDLAILTIDKFRSTELEEMFDSRMAEDVNDIINEYSDDWKKERNLNKASEAVKLLVRLMARSEYVQVRVIDIVILAFTVLFICLAVAFFVTSVISLISLLLNGGRSLFAASVKLLAAMPLFLIMLFMFHRVSGWDFSMCSGIVVLITVIFCLLAAYATIRAITKENRFKTSQIVKSAVSLVFSVIMVAFSSAPVLATEAYARFKNYDKQKWATAYFDSSVFTSMEVSEEEAEEYDDDEVSFESLFYLATSFVSKREFAEGTEANKTLLKGVVFCGSAHEFSMLFVLGSTMMLIALFGAFFVIWRNLTFLIFAQSRLNVLTKLFCGLSVVALFYILAVSILAAILGTYNADVLELNYYVNIGYGAVLLPILSIIVVSIPLSSRKKDILLESEQAE